jgi:hypothetical protein
MPNIQSIVPVYHTGMNPYHVDYDNLPLRNIEERELLINHQVDNITELVIDAKGTQGTFANRLNQSLDQNGNLIPAAVDGSLHSIGAHSDGIYSGIHYVRMTEDERSKLGDMSNSATALQIQFPTISSTVIFSDETLEFQNSDSVSWTVTAPNIITATTSFPNTAAHQHYYGVVPSAQNLSTPDYKNYVIPAAIMDDSLRVYVNGIRIPESTTSEQVFVYTAAVGPSGSWTALSFTSNSSTSFSLSSAITSSDAIQIDFDQSFV